MKRSSPAAALFGVTRIMKIENHLEVYVDDYGRVCMAQPSMDEECSVALEPEEVKTLISWLTDALQEAVGMSGKAERKESGKPDEETLPTS